MRREQALDEQRFASGESDLVAARPRTPQRHSVPIANRPAGSRFLPSQEWRRYLEASGVETIERA